MIRICPDRNCVPRLAVLTMLLAVLLVIVTTRVAQAQTKRADPAPTATDAVPTFKLGVPLTLEQTYAATLAYFLSNKYDLVPGKAALRKRDGKIDFREIDKGSLVTVELFACRCQGPRTDLAVSSTNDLANAQIAANNLLVSLADHIEKLDAAKKKRKRTRIRK